MFFADFNIKSCAPQKDIKLQSLSTCLAHGYLDYSKSLLIGQFTKRLPSGLFVRFPHGEYGDDDHREDAPHFAF